MFIHKSSFIFNVLNLSLHICIHLRYCHNQSSTQAHHFQNFIFMTFYVLAVILFFELGWDFARRWSNSPCNEISDLLGKSYVDNTLLVLGDMVDLYYIAKLIPNQFFSCLFLLPPLVDITLFSAFNCSIC